MQGIIRLVAVSLAGVVASFAFGGENTRPARERPPAPSTTLLSYLAGLDSNEFAAREAATAGLAKLIESPGERRAAEGLLRLPAWQSLSFDARQRLAAIGLVRLGGQDAVLPNPDTSKGEDLAALMKRLTSDRYLDRAEAIDKLHEMARRTATIHEFYPALKRAAADSALSLDARLTLELLLDSARHTWLTSTEHKRTAPSSPEQVVSWLDTLAAPDKGEGSAESTRNNARSISLTRNTAQRELLDALTQADTAPAVQKAIEAASARAGLDDDALTRLQQLSEWARPGLAAEYWQRRENLSVQFFVVGVPSQAPGARRATRFDRVSEDVALCGAGNALSPGEYPLGVAFPHPREQTSMDTRSPSE